MHAHTAAVVAQHTGRGVADRQGHREDCIDTIVALCMALDRSQQRLHTHRLGWL
jgi:hypothetical protein